MAGLPAPAVRAIVAALLLGSAAASVAAPVARAGAMAPGAAAALPASAQPADPALPAYVPQAVTIDTHASYLAADGAVRLGGAEHVDDILARANALFTSHHPGVRFVVETKGTSSAVPLLTHGKILFGAMGRAINPIERIPYKKIVGRDALEIAIAHTADNPHGHLATSLAVYVNTANPLRQISMNQLARILSVGNSGGDYSQWGQLGLGGAWKQRAIHPYGTPPYTGFGDYLQQAHLERRSLSPLTRELPSTEAIAEGIAADPAGIGVAAIGVTRAGLRQLDIVAADGTTITRGTRAEVAANAYPLGRHVYVYLRRSPGERIDPLAREYLRLLLSREGQAIVGAQPDGYIPLTAAQAAAELAKLDTAD